MEAFSWGLTFFVVYIPTLFALVMLVAAGILYSRTKTRATAAFFFGMLAATFVPWFIGFGRDLNTIRTLLGTVAVAAQSLGFLYYVLSLPKQAPQN